MDTLSLIEGRKENERDMELLIDRDWQIDIVRSSREHMEEVVSQ